MAVAIARQEIARAGYAGIEVASAGTAALIGASASREAVAVAEENGLSLSDHSARQLTPEMLAAADLVVAMGNEHADYARRLGARRVTLLSTGPVPDPYGRGIAVFRDTWTSLSSSIPTLLLSQHRHKLE